MKKCLKSELPELLRQYYDNNPEATWEQFKNECQEGYKQVQQQLRKDQGNLCCYCEIDTKYHSNDGKDDFRVEHFHPKSDKNSNWALDWTNMLGCCHGGTERDVTEHKNRFIENHNERHSDALKGEFAWDNEILNPIEIPDFPILFKANRRDGSLSVIYENCQQVNIDTTKAENCLNEKKLNLNSEKLKELRKSILDKINSEITLKLAQGLTMQQIMANLTESQLRIDSNGHYPTFFTSIRSFLGKNAEDYLRKMNYTG